jgi:hypothetical protein
MFLAKELHKSLEEVLEFSTLELRMWAAFYRYERSRQEDARMKNATRKPTRGR